MTSEAEVYEALALRVVVDQHGIRKYFNAAGQLHREDGPAIWKPEGCFAWYLYGRLHCVDGPAISEDDTLQWWREGQRHSTDGPAVIWDDGGKEWWQNDLRHREDGPAVVCSDGSEGWFLRGVAYSKCEFAALSHEKRACA